MYPSTFLNLHLKNTRKNSYSRKDIDFYNDKEFFRRLEIKSILSKEQLLDMSLRSMEGYLFINQSLYPPHQIRRLIDKRTHNGLMYCPKCLKEDRVPYWRKKWRYFFYTACPKHKIFLTDRCWHCNKPIKLIKIKLSDTLKYCYHCGADLSLTQTFQGNRPESYGLEAISWFEEGLKRGYFEINNQKVWSVMFFQIFCKLQHLLDKKQDLFLDRFSLLEKYKNICKKQKTYNSKKASAIYKSFYLNSMIFYLFQNFPVNFLEFIKLNNLGYRDFTHDLKYIPYWYKKEISNLISKQNKLGRQISESEVIGAINYLKSQNEVINQVNVSNVIGCHATTNSSYKGVYKKIFKQYFI